MISKEQIADLFEPVDSRRQMMISIKPEHAVNILNGDKTLELRTWIPKGYVGWVNVYVSKGKPFLAYEEVSYDDSWGYPATDGGYSIYNNIDEFDRIGDVLNGKVAFRFWFESYRKMDGLKVCNYYDDLVFLLENKEDFEDLKKRVCFDFVDKNKYGLDKKLYFWFIDDLEIFDKPLELSEFEPYCKHLGCYERACERDAHKMYCPYETVDYNPDGTVNVRTCNQKPLTKAPQKMVWVYRKE